MTRMQPPFVSGLALGALMMLAGCDSAFAPKAGPTASGEVLPGTVSDAMLGTDRSQAEAPLAPTAPTAADKDETVTAGASSDAVPDASAPTEGTAADEGTPAKPAPTASPKPALP